MTKIVQYFMVILPMLGHFMGTSAQGIIVSRQKNQMQGLPISLVDSIICLFPGKFNVYHGDNVLFGDTIIFNRQMSDTLLIDFCQDRVDVSNPDVSRFRVSIDGTKVYVKNHSNNPSVCRVSGTCQNGRFVMSSDAACTLVLDNLHLSSMESGTILLTEKEKVTIELPEGTHSILKDAEERTDTSDVSIGCLYAKGTTDFVGKGALDVSGQYRHAIASGKNINIAGPHITILDVKKNGIHCDKFTLKDGQIDLTLNHDVSKGIKAKKELNVEGGRINGEAYGNVEIKNGDVSYCTLLKSDGTMNVSAGTLSLRHYGTGGRCISVDSTVHVKGGTFFLETHGDGDSYLTEQGDTAYFTPKCITADDSVFVERGSFTCLSTGLGGKGIVAGKYMSIGKEETDSLPLIRIETKGECIKNDVKEDERSGCPKGIKAEEELHIYGGDIAVTTAGMGGEGVECNGDMHIHGGTLECNTFDDGINIGRSIEISGGYVYCNSLDNDGIDSNGNITISGGVVAAVNQNYPDESFDTEEGQLILLGGIVFGIGSGPVEIMKSLYPCYSTPYNTSPDGPRNIGLILTEGKYVYLKRGNEILLAMLNDNKEMRSFITVMYPHFIENEICSLCEGEKPGQVQQSYFGERLLLGGVPHDTYHVDDVQVEIIK